MASHTRVQFQLSISADDYVTYYQGVTRAVSILGDNGKRIEFPAEHLRQFVTHDGVHGNFELEFDDNNRFVALKKID